ncbi:hypothetical protein [Actinosynnema sp. NPDC023587]|uniref:hypothetical protein n=1 Tax=Actinosynnema sp. NPDC023587 TaxID=3154695 RepID=UPI0033C4DF9E
MRKLRADRSNEAVAETKKAVVQAFRRGATGIAVSPLSPDAELAQITVTKATYKATTRDRTKTEDWIKANYGEKVKTRTRIVGSDTDVLNVLRTLAPYLLEEEEYVPDNVIYELELKSQKARQPMGWGGEVGDDAPPGIEVTISDPKVNFTFRDRELIDDLITSGVVDEDGTITGHGA